MQQQVYHPHPDRRAEDYVGRFAAADAAQTDGRTDIRSMLNALRYKHGQRNKATNRTRPVCESHGYIILSW